MILAVDVHYLDSYARIAGVMLQNWDDPVPQHEYLSIYDDVAAYVPGQFYQRELPCILHLLREHELAPQTIVVDGYVFLDGHTKAGLGKHLFDALAGQVAIIGVAKRVFRGIDEQCKLYRGQSQTPLFVTAVNVELEQAKTCIQKMHGQHRLPTLLKRVDQICRGTVPK